MSLEVIVGEQDAEFYARPTHGRPVAFFVEYRSVRTGHYGRGREMRWVVTLKGNRAAEFSRHLSEETAHRAALRRARKYDAAYSVPRGLAVAS